MLFCNDYFRTRYFCFYYTIILNFKERPPKMKRGGETVFGAAYCTKEVNVKTVIRKVVSVYNLSKKT